MPTVSEIVSGQIGSALSNIRTWGNLIYNVIEFGAKGDGTNDTVYIAAAIQKAVDAGGGTVVFPCTPTAHTYLTTDITFPSNVTAWVFTGAKLLVNSPNTVNFNGPFISELTQSLSGTGTYVFNDIQELFPEWFGAKGDGTTDDTSSIQKTIDCCPTLGKVYLSQKQYKVTQLQIVNKNSITLTGTGELKGSANTVIVSIFGVVYISNSANILIDNIGLSGVYSGVDDRGFWIANSQNVTVKQCRISNFSQEAFILWGANNSVEPTNHVLDNYIVGNGYGIKTTINGEYWEISRNKIINNTYGIYGGLGNCRIDNNKIIQNINGIILDGTQGSNPDHSSISCNQINHNRAIGLMLTNIVSGQSVVNNEILSTVGPETWPTTGKSHGLILVNVKDVIMMGNRIDSNNVTSSYIYVDGHTDCRYIGNTINGGQFKEISSGTNNYFIGNRYLLPAKLSLFSGSIAIRSMEQENGVFLGDITSVINKIPVTSFLNGWSNDPGYYPLTYWRDGEGCVHIQGSITGGTVTTDVFNLPVNFRPSAAVDIVAIANNTGVIAGFRIYANGNVQQLSGGNTHVSINAMFKP